MKDRDIIVAFLGTLVAIIILAVCGTIAAKNGKDPSVYVAAITGLIGVIGAFKPRGPNPGEKQ